MLYSHRISGVEAKRKSPGSCDIGADRETWCHRYEVPPVVGPLRVMMRPEELHLTFVMSPLGSARLLIRPFEQADVESVHEINPALRSTSKEQKEVIRGYLLWSNLNHTELARQEWSSRPTGIAP